MTWGQRPQPNQMREGRHTIDSYARMTSYSKRAENNTLEVIRMKCPYCHHHKALRTSTILKCARCKRYIKQ